MEKDLTYFSKFNKVNTHKPLPTKEENPFLLIGN
ncbi:hypothetical protein BROSI_A1468 [Candidatus Brocadia sinica JPN1]|uniref:Uncharacterized protein n=1 Tax=Candidatus Brocadia sinica JPN1 TaxID=1197129 RepID=A0ABQ0JW34_9BACT|nr:hypothetical protein BROSI_A1468 [Candidatus Brocadia sinica JPN1]